MDLKRLEERVTSLINVCGALRDENAQLRQELHQVTQDSTRLKQNMQLASQQLETLMEALPAESVEK
ncbi:MAG TPA: hypothetical protein VGD04_01630 [Methylophilus sp.]